MSATKYTMLYPAQNAPYLIIQIAKALASGEDINLHLDEDHGAIHLRINDSPSVPLLKDTLDYMRVN